MAHYVKTLDQLTLKDIPLAGGKACRLGELARAGLPVPRGLAILTTTYEDVLEASGLGRRCAQREGPGRAEEVRRHLLSAPLPEGLEEELSEALLRAGLEPGTPLAVRSSSPGEDGAYRSRAGAYESVLNVTGLEAVTGAVRSCWASLWTERALALDGGGGAGPSMAVLVQELVPCEAAGILFTLNPLTADESEMLVEATWGLAAELASGDVTPDRFVIDFWNGRALRSEAGRKPEALAVSPGGGIERRPVDAAEARALCLDGEQLSELAALGRRAQEVFGCPQDVEFGFAGGRPHVFQARPITAYSFPPGTGQWTTANFREVMPGFASMLGQSQSFHHDFSRAQEELFKRLRLWRAEDEGTVWSRSFFGHGYWNVGATKRLASRLPGFNERSFDRTVGIDPAYDGDGQVTPWTPATIARAIPVLLALSREYARVPAEARRFINWFDGQEPSWDQVRPADLDESALAGRVRWGLDLHWQANRWALLCTFLSTQAQEDFHHLLAGLEVRARARAGAGKAGSVDLPSEARLLTGLEGMATAKPLHDMWELAESLRGHPEALRTLRETAPAELAGRLSELSRRGPDAGAWRLVRGWIERYRYMSNIDEDLSVPRWSEDPSVPLSMLRGYLSDAPAEEGPAGPGSVAAPVGTPVDGGAAGSIAAAAACAAAAASPAGATPAAAGPLRRPAEYVSRQRRIREEEEAKARALGRRWFRLGLDPFWTGRFIKQYELVKSLCWWREETRVCLSRARYHTRRFLVEQARRWADAGLLGDPGDIFWLTRGELLALVPEPPAAASPKAFALARKMARRRRSMSVLYRNFAVPPNILPGPFGADGLPRASGAVSVGQVEMARPASAAVAEQPRLSEPGAPVGVPPRGDLVLGGVGCSAGRAAGRCRVARDIVEASRLEAGEILVAPHANPAWVPLFHLAAGLVLEEGGLLSHSAVVAREYGIPAVLQVKEATRLLETGDAVELDGLTGVVRVSRA